MGAKMNLPQLTQIKKVDAKELHDPGQNEITLKAVINNFSVDIHPAKKYLAPERVVATIGHLEVFLSMVEMDMKLSISASHVRMDIQQSTTERNNPVILCPGLSTSATIVRFPVMLNDSTPPISTKSYLELLGFKRFAVVDSLKLQMGKKGQLVTSALSKQYVFETVTIDLSVGVFKMYLTKDILIALSKFNDALQEGLKDLEESKLQ